MMCINAVKGVKIGAGFNVVTLKGTEHRDTITALGFKSHNAGGTLGDINRKVLMDK
jgi:chorismate synthase